jgi:hypothetical protein
LLDDNRPPSDWEQAPVRHGQANPKRVQATVACHEHLFLQVKYVGDGEEQNGLLMIGLNMIDKTLAVWGARLAYNAWNVVGTMCRYKHQLVLAFVEVWNLDALCFSCGINGCRRQPVRLQHPDHVQGCCGIHVHFQSQRLVHPQQVSITTFYVLIAARNLIVVVL